MLSNTLSSCLLFSGGGARFSEQLSHLGSLRNREGASTHAGRIKHHEQRQKGVRMRLAPLLENEARLKKRLLVRLDAMIWSSQCCKDAL